jgi:hypothetical protein
LKEGIYIMENPIIHVWITKYALTQGIFEIDATVCTKINKDMIEEVGAGYPTMYHREGEEWHRTKESAIKRAEEMKQAKIKSVKKQLNKLENLKFE